MASTDPMLDATFAALADPTRRAIVARLAGGDATVLELAAPLDISLPAISRHLKVLEQAGLIERGRDAQRRPCSLRPEALASVSAVTVACEVAVISTLPAVTVTFEPSM